MAYRSNSRAYLGWPIMVIVLLVGALLGSWLGEVLIGLIPVLAEVGQIYVIGIPHFTMDLQVLSFSFGLTLRVGLFTLLGIVGAYFVYRKM
ncbi:MAG: DUF4321 domain-containing protein [Syntrophomonadaceae bacterium]|nr:DUF4321 domain-containing protein [Syntrophomonadaceae bacterium]